jgi:hypothetical protein
MTREERERVCGLLAAQAALLALTPAADVLEPARRRAVRAHLLTPKAHEGLIVDLYAAIAALSREE